MTPAQMRDVVRQNRLWYADVIERENEELNLPRGRQREFEHKVYDGLFNRERHRV